MTCWFVSMEPSVPNLLRGRRVRRARVLHPLRTARNRPRASHRCSFAPRGNDRGGGSRETRKRVKKEGSKVVCLRRRRRRGARFRRVSSFLGWRRRTGKPTAMDDAVFSVFFCSRFARSSAVSDCISLSYTDLGALNPTTSLRRRIGNPRAREASTPRRFTENLVTTADGATFRAVFL